MAIIEWCDDRFLLGIDDMDRTHIEFVNLVNSMEVASGDEFIRLFDAMLAHTRAHFEQENRLMVKHDFAAIAEHRDEHERMLGEMTRFSRSNHKGRVAFGRNYVSDSLAQWFPLHAATMDSALAAHIKSRMTVSGIIPVTVATDRTRTG